MTATTIEQSKTLIELGVEANTADMHYSKWDNDEEEEYLLKCGELPKLDFKYAKNIPAWSLSALMQLMPSATLDSSNDHFYRLRCMEKFSEWRNNPIDAVFEMVCRLLKNKIIK